MDKAIASFMNALRPGRVRTALCSDVVDVLARVVTALEATGRGAVLTWEPGTRVADATAAVVQRLAEAARLRWEALPGEGNALPAAVNLVWYRQARRLRETGRLPIPPGFSDGVHIQHLGPLLADGDFPILFALPADTLPPSDRIAFRAAALWVAAESGQPVGVFLPEGLGQAPELDAILYDAVRLTAPAPASPEPAPRGLLAPPLVGRPNPTSPGECLLAERLAKDSELAGLFAFNSWVGDGTQRFLVDLLWEKGKLVVEVDGYRWHSTESMFRSDRYRDYRLMTWGHLVLRLPHDEVMADVALQIEKIRDMVRLIGKRDGL